MGDTRRPNEVEQCCDGEPGKKSEQVEESDVSSAGLGEEEHRITICDGSEMRIKLCKQAARVARQNYSRLEFYG